MESLQDDDISPDLRDRVLERFGFAAAPPTDVGGLRALYSAWCARVPFDNVRKMVALRTGQPLPGLTAEDFFEAWLAHGAGGTCWGGSNALFALFRAAGFDVTRIAGSMRDIGTGPREAPGHGSTVARIDSRSWLIDSSMLTNIPLPLDDDVFVGADPVFAAEIEPLEGGHRAWFCLPPHATHFPCWLPAGEATYSLYRTRYEASRERSPFNQRLYARRNRPGEMLVLAGNMRYSRTATGVDARECAPDELTRFLRDEIGLSEALVEEWARCGGLEDSYQPPSGPPPPQFEVLPPSLRS